MAREIDNLKKELKGEIFSIPEIENKMNEYEYTLVETEDLEDDSNTIKFTNYKSQIWIEVDTDEENNVLIADLKRVTKLDSESTRVDPFKTFEDYEIILSYFKEKNKHNHWLTGALMAALGRRVGDIISLKWSDFFSANGKYKKRLNNLKEEKTGKVVGALINALARYYIDIYCNTLNINPLEHLDKKIFSMQSASFRKYLKQAVEYTGIEGVISTHSFRKFYANTIYKLHPQDADNLMIIQTIFGHSDINTTKIYIGEIDNKIDKYNDDYSEYMLNLNNGIVPEVSNSPVISLKSEDLRNIMSLCWDAGSNMEDKYESLNNLIKLAEECMV